MQNRPLVQRLERDWTEGHVVTLDIMKPLIRQFANEVGFEATPTFILYDAQGDELQRWVGRAPSLDELQRPTR
ncbi:MAG TPA: hypothetical protein VL334_09750 [Anaerolineae bacterium]|nr:hypothetical protein [Anaerolineae bacterium]